MSDLDKEILEMTEEELMKYVDEQKSTTSLRSKLDEIYNINLLNEKDLNLCLKNIDNMSDETKTELTESLDILHKTYNVIQKNKINLENYCEPLDKIYAKVKIDPDLSIENITPEDHIKSKDCRCRFKECICKDSEKYESIMNSPDMVNFTYNHSTKTPEIVDCSNIENDTHKIIEEVEYVSNNKQKIVDIMEKCLDNTLAGSKQLINDRPSKNAQVANQLYGRKEVGLIKKIDMTEQEIKELNALELSNKKSISLDSAYKELENKKSKPYLTKLLERSGYLPTPVEIIKKEQSTKHIPIGLITNDNHEQIRAIKESLKNKNSKSFKTEYDSDEEQLDTDNIFEKLKNKLQSALKINKSNSNISDKSLQQSIDDNIKSYDDKFFFGVDKLIEDMFTDSTNEEEVIVKESSQNIESLKMEEIDNLLKSYINDSEEKEFLSVGQINNVTVSIIE